MSEIPKPTSALYNFYMAFSKETKETNNEAALLPFMLTVY